MKGGIHAEDGFALLHAFDSTRGEAFTVSNTIYMKNNRLIDPARAQEVAVKRVARSIKLNGRLECRQCLSKNQPAKQSVAKLGI